MAFKGGQMKMGSTSSIWGIGLLRLMIVLLEAPQWTKGFQIEVEKLQCILQFVNHDGASVSGNFVVVDKKFDWNSQRDDIELVVAGPSGDRVYQAKARGGQKFMFKAPKQGRYNFCFYNPTGSPEKVDFTIHVGPTMDPRDVAKDEHFDPLQIKITQLREALEKVSLEQRYYKSRDDRHRRTNESTQKRLFWYTAAEYVLLIGVSLLQVFLIQRLFSKRIGYNKV